MNRCLNCQNTFTGKYCNNCGQKSATGRLSLHYILHDFQHSVLHFDKGFFYNLRTIYRPKLILEYVQGRRVNFFSPILYVLLISGLLVYLEANYYIRTPIESKHKLTDSLYSTAFQAGKLYKVYAKYFEVAIIIPLAMLATAFFRKHNRFNFTENLYVFAFIFANASLFAIAAFPFTRHLLNFFGNKLVVFPLLIFYTCLIYSKGNPVVTVLKSVLMVVIAHLVFFAFLLFAGFIFLLVKSQTS